jgi:hypothetical protein
MPNIFGLNEWRNHDNLDLQAPLVLLFGDSWFWYPIPGVGSLADKFNDFGRAQALSLVSIGDVGMEIGDPGKPLLYQLSTFLQWEAGTVDLIAVSGGGNDFAGPDDLDPLMRSGNPNAPKSWFKKAEMDDLFQRIRAGYERVIYLRDTFCPGVTILTHAYDYAHASGRGFLTFSPWIKPSFDTFKVPDALRPALVKIIIDRLALVQTQLAKQTKNYKFINTRGSLTAAEWSNEIHPTREGFQKLAGKFFPQFKSRFPDWVVKPKWLS